MTVEHWKREPEDHDYPAATSYLSLLVGAEAATKLVRKLQKQDVLVHRAAKDLLRASRLQLSGTDDSEVAADLKKIKGGPSSPLFYWCREIRCGWPMAITGFASVTTSTRRPKSPAESSLTRQLPANHRTGAAVPPAVARSNPGRPVTAPR